MKNFPDVADITSFSSAKPRVQSVIATIPDVADLQSVTVTNSASFQNLGGFKDGNIAPALNDYEYDENGNMIMDRNKGITSITYNYLNLPQTIIFNHGDKIEYIYNAAGVKIRKTVRGVIL